MSDNVTTTEPPADAEPTEAADAAPPDGELPALPALRSKEAARYRTRLREVEAERDGLAGRLAAHQRTEAERLATVGTGRGLLDVLADGRDLWGAGVVLADVVDEDGQVDPERVKLATERVLREHPHWVRRVPPSFDGGARQSHDPSPSFHDVLRGRI